MPVMRMDKCEHCRRHRNVKPVAIGKSVRNLCASCVEWVRASRGAR